MLSLGFKFGDEFLLSAVGLPPIRICLVRGKNTGARSIGFDAPDYVITRIPASKPAEPRVFPKPSSSPPPVNLSSQRLAHMPRRQGAERRIARKGKVL